MREINHIFFSEQLRLQLAFVEHLCHYSDQAILVVGPAGSGKTTFLNAFIDMDLEGSPLEKRFLSFTEDLNDVDVFDKRFNAELQQDSAVKEGMHSKKILLVDDFDRVDDIFLDKMLSALRDASAKEFHRQTPHAFSALLEYRLVFAVSHVFLERLQDPLFSTYPLDALFHIVELEPFSLEETHAFVRKKLLQELESGADLPDITLVYEWSEGWPGRILQHLAQFKEEGEKAVSSKVSKFSYDYDKKDVRKIGFFLVGLSFLGGLGFILTKNKPIFPQKEPIQLVLLDQVLSEKEIEPSSNMNETFSPSLPDPEAGLELLIHKAQEAHPSHSTLPSMIEALSAEIQPENCDSEEVQKEPQERATESILESEKALRGPEPFQTNPKSERERPSEDVKIPQDPLPQLKKPQTSSYYAIQLMGTYHKDAAEGFIKTHSISKLHLLKVERQGKPWFLVLYGNFASFPEAKRALTSLPVALKAKHPSSVERPWIRKCS